MDELRKAAARGVRVRLLLDDNGIGGLDDDLAALNALSNVEVRLFNPFILRTLKALGFAFDFFRLNRRMHNKSLTADGSIGILGGRNVGDIYFGFGEGVHYLDTDVMVAGEIAGELGADFDRYWRSRSSQPLERIVDVASPGSLDRLTFDATQASGSPAGGLYEERLRQSRIVRQIAAGQVDFERAHIELVSDDPSKGMGEAERRDLLFSKLMALIAKPERSVDLVSAYFVPGEKFSAALGRLAGAGVSVRILTNSQSATDVVAVHSAYIKYRSRLLQSGVRLYELKPAFAPKHALRARSSTGSSSASLHSKTLAVDEQSIFIGSFNFDNRSLLLNTEMGVLIESPRLASSLSAAFSEKFP